MEWSAAALAAQRNRSSSFLLKRQPVEAPSFDGGAPGLRGVFQFERLFGATPGKSNCQLMG